MKKFLLKVLAFLLVMAALTLTINHVYMRMDGADPDNTRKFQSMGDEIQLCNFGSSHGACDYQYDEINGEIECFNFGLDSQLLSYDARLFDYYADHLAPGGVVFITISYFSFYGVDEVERDRFQEKNKRYYKILPRELIKQYDWKTDFYTRLPALTAGPRLYRVFSGKVKPYQYIRNKKTSKSKAEEGSKKAAKRHVITDKIDQNGHRIVDQEEVDAVIHMINGCKERDLTPVLITPPYLKEYTDAVAAVDPDFYDEFYAMIDSIKDETKVEYYDYARDKRFNTDYDLFTNSDHLNDYGARKFVKILLEEVVHYGTEESLIVSNPAVES